jgi:FtsH-binding integral membrane protein
MTMALEHPVRRNTDRIFFSGMALALASMMVAGFWPTYFMRNAALPPLTWLYHAHGALFVCWMLLFIVQTSLISSQRTDLHRKLGVLGAAVAALMFAMGVTVSIETLRRGGGPPAGDPRFFFAIPMGDMFVFGALAAAGILMRRRTDWHKRFMLLASISVITAAVARFLVQIGMGGPGLFVGTDLFVLAVVIYDFVTRGRVHPATLWGGLAVGVFKPLLFALSGTAPWLAFADAMR